MGAGGGSLVSKTKIKNEVKKAFRLPSNAVVMSMMAIILVCAAPALVSVIDDSYTYEGSSEIQLLDVPSTEDSYVRLVPTDENPSNSASVSYIPASQNDSTFVMALNDPSEVDNVAYARFSGIDMAPLMSGMGTVKVVTSCDLTSVMIGLESSDEGTSNVFKAFTKSEVDSSVWTISLDSIDLIKLKSGAYENMYIQMEGQNEVFDMEIFASGEYVIPYGEMIIGATGALLLICAILATPWMSTAGLTVKKRR